jgi:hypothetical protein
LKDELQKADMASMSTPEAVAVLIHEDKQALCEMAASVLEVDELGKNTKSVGICTVK